MPAPPDMMSAPVEVEVACVELVDTSAPEVFTLVTLELPS